jgi:prephenate dehydrogenase
VGVVGLGQVGGSLVKSLRAHHALLTVLGYDRDAALAERVRRWCRWRGTLARLVEASDVIVLAVPVPAIMALFPAIADAAARRRRQGALVVCDTGTLKVPIMAAARPWRGAFDLVGLHPLAGTEGRGWESARAGMFRGQKIVYCGGRPEGQALCRELIELVGGVPVEMNPQVHDRMVAEAIGLPHVLAFASAGLGRSSKQPNSLKGGSWQSLTRVAHSDAAMVAGFLSENAPEQMRVLRRFRRQLDRFQTVLAREDAEALETLLRRWQEEKAVARRRHARTRKRS